MLGALVERPTHGAFIREDASLRDDAFPSPPAFEIASGWRPDAIRRPPGYEPEARNGLLLVLGREDRVPHLNDTVFKPLVSLVAGLSLGDDARSCALIQASLSFVSLARPDLRLSSLGGGNLCGSHICKSSSEGLQL